jgi:nicotinamidase-related amidase
MSETALLVIDMLNTYDHPDAEDLATHAEEMVGTLADLVGRARTRDDVDVIYVNDNQGDFSADRGDLIRGALDGKRPDLVEPIVPGDDATFLTKVRHSAFYGTPLDYLLGRLGAKRVILTGQVTEQCILYTALDGYIRHLDVIVPPDAVAHIHPDLGQAALALMERNMHAELKSAVNCL